MPWKLKRSNTFRTITIWALSFSLFNPYWFNVPFLYPRKWLTFSVGMKCVKTSKVVARRCSAKKVFWPRSLLKKRVQQFALHCVKSVRIQSECGKIRTRKTPNTDPFHAVLKISKNEKFSDVSKSYRNGTLGYFRHLQTVKCKSPKVVHHHSESSQTPKMELFCENT